MKHVDPDFTPKLNWGDPIPMIWTQDDREVWQAWAPKQFATALEGIEITWRSESANNYKPSAPSLVQQLNQLLQDRRLPDIKQGFGFDAPMSAWGAGMPASWHHYPDGNMWVQTKTLKVEIGNKQAWLQSSYPYIELYYFGFIIENPPAPRGTSSSYEGWSVVREFLRFREPDPFLWLRTNTDPNCSRWPCRVRISPSAIEITDTDKSQLKPCIPSDKDIANEKRRYAESGNPLPDGSRDVLTFIKDLGQSEKLLERIKGDTFAKQFQFVVHHHEIIYDANGARIWIPGEDSAWHVTASLRPFGESFHAMRYFYMKPESEVFEDIKSILKDEGYTLS